MCLLKRDEQDTNCGHDECKNYYALNKQLCAYTLQSSQTQPNPANPQFQSLHHQPLILQQPPQHSSNGINVKRPMPADLESFSFVQKKIRTEGSIKHFIQLSEQLKDGEQSQSFIEMNNKLHDYQMNKQGVFSNNQQQERQVFASQLLNNIIVGAPQQQGVSFTGPTIMVPLVQGNQPQFAQQVPQLIQTPSSGNNTNQYNQMLSQNQKNKPQQIVQMGQINPGIGSTDKSKESPASEAFMKEFQSRILGLLFTQNKMLVDLKDKNEVMQDTLACLITEINSLKMAIKNTHSEKSGLYTSNPIISHQIIGNSTENVTVDHLITYLFGPTPDFQYQLILKSELALPLYRERNFRFTVLLTDLKGHPIENANRIPLTIGLYTSENPPKYIDCNTAGNKILKGFIEKDLVNGSASFEKIQIKEVSSHFRNGWIFFAIYPKIQGSTSSSLTGNGNIIPSHKIKPLILEKVIVKAKKAKGKDLTADDDVGDTLEGGKDDNSEERELKGEKDDSAPKEEVVYA